MFRTRSYQRTFLSATVLTTMLLSGACSDSTAPSTDNASGEAVPQAPSPSGPAAAPRDTTSTLNDTTMAQVAPPPASAVQLSQSGHTGLVYSPRATCYGDSQFLPRIIDVSAMRAGDALNSFFTQQAIIAEYFLNRWEGGKWVPIAKLTGRNNVYNVGTTVTIPGGSFFPTAAGYYMIQVRVSWYAYFGNWQGTKWIGLNSSSDYRAAAAAVVGSGYCYIY